ncbi:MAG: hypothetical protein AW10_00715 [Candidatus Accumulibacter appositus]|uniref:DUF3179 domain-containing protein n=2 Tax=Candidatus Accumulibacter TaxID=327159 RepID=A0A011PZ70_9PROT|nr:MAG: hypothetical protein AW10_00715 [Candidatus Accumulibacter appositus]
MLSGGADEGMRIFSCRVEMGSWVPGAGRAAANAIARFSLACFLAHARICRFTRLFTVCLTLLAAQWAAAAPLQNGFDLADALVPVEAIFAGGPPRDGIPAIDRPHFLPASAAGDVQPQERVLGVSLNGVAKAYPIAILNWHEIVNDTFGDTPVAVTYCPLCGTGMVFLAQVAGQAVQFGVSGLLYNSDVLLYDRQSASLWSQIDRRAISGKHKGQRLTALPLEHTRWGDWRQRHPETLVLSRNTGHFRDYDRNPYAAYESEEELYFPVRFRAQGYHPKERVLGLEIDGQFKAYPFAELAKSAGTSGSIRDRVGGQPIVVHFDAENANATARDADGKPLAGVVGYWFAWYAFHPETAIYRAASQGAATGAH